MKSGPATTAPPSPAIRVLILEDEAAHAELMVRELHKAGFTPRWHRVETEPEYAASLDPELDLILADNGLPGLDARRALSLLQDQRLDIPFVVVSGAIGEDVAVSLMQLGAADYVLKDRLARLGQAVHRALEQRALRQAKQRADVQLRESEERYRTLFEGVPAGLYRATPAGRILDVNPAFLHILGYPDLETLVAVNASALYVDPGVRKQLAARLEREGLVADYESELRRYDGATIWVRAGARAVRDASGGVTHYEGAMVEITDRKRAEQKIRDLNAQLEQRVAEQTAELKEAKAFLEGLIAMGPSIIFKLDSGVTPTRAMTYVSPNIARLLGYRQEEVLGVPGFWEGHMHPEDLEMFRAGNATALRERRTQFEHEVRIQHRDGTYRWMHSALRVVYDQSGAPVSIFGYDQDVTARRAAEEAVTQARMEAERANRAKSGFLSRMSHELRTPLNAILGFAQLLEMDSLSPEQHESVNFIVKGGRHLLELINEVLDLARIEAGRLALSPEPVLVRALVRETIELVRPLAAEKNIQLNAGAPGGPELHILADGQRVKQVLLNLLSNAIKYSPKGGTVTVSHQDTAGGRLRIKVRDTGPGIPPDRMERLFTPFERLGAERTAIEGTGLGLALSKGLVEAMGGTLGVESTLGGGSTFWVELAQVESPVAQLKPHGQEAPGPAERAASPQVRTVLYVEDNLSNVELIQRILTHRPGVRLLPAMQGRLGLDLARQHQPDLILLDLHLPDIPGDEVLRRLQEIPETRHIPVAVLSADASPGQIQRLLTAGAWRFLTKPIDVKNFLSLVDEALRKRESD